MEPASEDLRNDGMSFIWKIHNYSFCALSNRYHNKAYIQSPDFELDTRRFSLLVYNTQDYLPHDSNGIGFRLFMDHGQPVMKVDYEISILTTSGSFKKLGVRNIIHPYSRSCTSPFDFFQFPSLRKKKGGLNNYLDNDTLTVKCGIFKVNDVVLNHQTCCVHTVSNVERTIYNWNIDTLCNSNPSILQAIAKPNLFSIKNVTINALLEKCSKVPQLRVIIKRGNVDKLSFSICTISVVENGRIIHSNQYERWFSISAEEQIWEVLFLLKKTANREKENCKQFLRFEFATSDGSSTVGAIEHGTDEDQVLNSVYMQSDGVRSWKNNLQRFFSEGKLSDITLRTLEKEFAAHKAMLCAQSNVFRAMFEHDMKENQTGVVEIEDLDDETVSRLLQYVYTGIVKNIDWETATKLYFAADKYEITALKEQCSMFLTANLGVSNVCKCLILADMHQDQSLKTLAQKFVLKHSPVVMQSEEWKELMKNHVNLAAETMYLSFSKNS